MNQYLVAGSHSGQHTPPPTKNQLPLLFVPPREMRKKSPHPARF